jgi:hypothetical protein
VGHSALGKHLSQGVQIVGNCRKQWKRRNTSRRHTQVHTQVHT